MLIGPQISADDAAIVSRWQSLRRRIEAAARSSGRTVESVTLVAVSKGQEAAAVRSVARLGIRDIGESYLQEALPKRAALADLPLHWHFIGRLQANKTRPIAEQFDWVHGIDRLRIAERLSAQRPEGLPPLQVCIHVNIAAEQSKAGIAPAELPALAAAVEQLPRLRLRGLMCILPQGQPPAVNRRQFATLRALLGQLRAEGRLVDSLSMGMSEDFSEAIAEGATLVRIGSALFGPRARSAPPDADG